MPADHAPTADTEFDLDLARGSDPAHRLAGRVAIVTGGGSSGPLPGTGVAIATLFASQGAQVGVVDISEDRAARTVGLIERIGGRAMAVVADVTAATECDRAVSEVVARFGRLDILVNNAAISGGGGTVTTIDESEWNRGRGVGPQCRHADVQVRRASSGRDRRRVHRQHVVHCRHPWFGERGLRGRQSRRYWPDPRPRLLARTGRHPGQLRRPRPPLYPDGEPRR